MFAPEQVKRRMDAAQGQANALAPEIEHLRGSIPQWNGDGMIPANPDGVSQSIML